MPSLYLDILPHWLWSARREPVSAAEGSRWLIARTNVFDRSLHPKATQQRPRNLTLRRRTPSRRVHATQPQSLYTVRRLMNRTGIVNKHQNRRCAQPARHPGDNRPGAGKARASTMATKAWRGIIYLLALEEARHGILVGTIKIVCDSLACESTTHDTMSQHAAEHATSCRGTHQAKTVASHPRTKQHRAPQHITSQHSSHEL